jgi:hypothetical protein
MLSGLQRFPMAFEMYIQLNSFSHFLLFFFDKTALYASDHSGVLIGVAHLVQVVV